MKKKAFFENAALLAERLQIIPLLYGSLGLEYATGGNLNADDIDILIPEVFLKERWDGFVTVLTEAGYVLVDLHEHTFRKDGVEYSYASLEELEPFAGIPAAEIAVKEENGVSFRLLSPEQYLRVYETSIRDGYRITVRNKKDREKIEFITEFMKRRDGGCSTTK